jgi:uncharacterized membrane protein YeaQ/YmgE (transglycosylase-associated protein family)
MCPSQQCATTRFAKVDASGLSSPTPEPEENTMTLEGLIIVLIIGALAGWLAGLVMKGRGFGLLGDIVVGIVGAFLGSFLLAVFGIAFYGLLGTLLTAFLGAVVLLFIVRMLKKA